MVAQFSDGTGVVELVWFKGGKWIQDKIKPKEVYVVSGKISQFQQTIRLLTLILNCLKILTNRTNWDGNPSIPQQKN